jgi:hypothetical protein
MPDPVVEGERIHERVNPEDFRKVADAVDTVNEAMKNLTRGTTQAANVLGLMVDTMNKSRYSFSEFMSILEKTTVLTFAGAKGFNELTLSIKSATSSTEGLMSAIGALSSKTMPELAQHIAMSTSKYREHIEVLKTKKSSIDEEINFTKQLIAGIEAKLNSNLKLLDIYKLDEATTKRLTDESLNLGETLGVLKEKEGVLEQQSSKTGEQIKETSEALDTLGKTWTKTLGWITLAITATLGMASAIDTAIKSEREVAYLGARMGETWGRNQEAMARFQNEFVTISSSWGMLREELAKMVAPLSALGVGVGPGGIAKTFDDASKTIEIAANWTGGMMRAYGIEAGITTKTMGTLSTTFNLGGERLSGVFADIYTQGQKSVLGMQGYITNLTSMIESSRRYGASLEGTMATLSVWDEEVKKGTLTLDNLVKLTTPAMMTTEQQAAIVTLMGKLAPKEAKALGIEGGDIYKNLINFQKMSMEHGATTAAGIIEMNKALARGGKTEEERTFLMQQLLKATAGIDIPLYQAVDALQDPKKLAELLEKAKPKTPIEAFNEMRDSYKKTISEGMAGHVESLRNGVLNIYNFMTNKWGGPSEATKRIEAGERGLGEGEKWINALPISEKEKEAKRTELYSPMLTWIDPGELNLPKGKKGRQTGGYISEDAEYKLEAGEQVRRPGEGSGGNINVSLGGINVTVGDRGSMRGQLDEAFERMKQETIKEIENQWTESLTTH